MPSAPSPLRPRRIRALRALGPLTLLAAACAGPGPGRAPEGGESGAVELRGSPEQEPEVGPEGLLSRSDAARVTAEGGGRANPPRTGAPGAAEDGAGGEDTWLRGRVSARYRGRWRGGEEDHDLTTTLALEGGESPSDTWTFSFLGSLFADLDGLADPDQRLFGLNDTWDHALLGRVYHAFAERRGSGELGRVRLGRQHDWETPEQAWFDGVTLVAGELAPGEPELGLYGGIPVHTYESSPEGDLLFGAWAELLPWKGARARIDWMHVEDEYLARDHENDLAALGLWQRLGRRLRVEAGYTNLDGDSRDVRAAANWVSEDGELALRVRYDRLLEAQRSQALETDPFYDSLQELFPYEQVRASLAKQWGERLRLEGGLDFRQVDDEDDKGLFNRDFDRTFLNATWLEGLPLELQATLTFDRYDSGGIETRVLGGDLTRQFGRRTRASLGTYYGLYEYDVFNNSEREDVRTWYLRVRRELSERTRLDLRYEYEDDDLDDYHTVRVGTTWSF